MSNGCNTPRYREYPQNICEIIAIKTNAMTQVAPNAIFNSVAIIISLS
ncbi:hypothetical protein [Shewanella sp. YIC-542]